MDSIQRQYELWPTRTRFYRRHIVETKLLASAMGPHRRLAWLSFLAGSWHTFHNGVRETVRLKCEVDSLSITWLASGCESRKLDWSWGGFKNTFTLAGGGTKHIIRWRPSLRHFLFDDDHVVWTPHNSENKRLSKGIIVYTRVKRNLKFFKNIDPREWCALGLEVRKLENELDLF